jgi:hypothetical protein
MDIKLDDTKTEANVEAVVLVLGHSKENKSEKIFEGEKGRIKIKLIKENNKWLLWEAEFLEKATIMGQEIS